MKIVFLTIAYNTGRNIYSDLMAEFVGHGHEVYVVCQIERRNTSQKLASLENNINILRVKTGNLTGKVSLLEKGFTLLSLDWLFKRTIKNALSDVHFDLVLYSTPPITFGETVKFIKNRDKAESYLLLKDIFPQNAVDMKMLSYNSLLYKYFRKKEKKLYAISDYIGCMSPANVKYLKEHNNQLDARKIEVNPNSVRPSALTVCDAKLRITIREKYHIPGDAVVFVYGGNLGVPQGLDFLVEVCQKFINRTDIYFLIVGAGQKFDYLQDALRKLAPSNAALYQKLPKEDYDMLLKVCDVGMIFLSPKFTIPNFPSRLTAYMDMALPVIAATDTATDMKDIIKEVYCGLWSQSGNINEFAENVNLLVSDKKLREQMGNNGRRYLEANYTSIQSYHTIMKHFTETEAHSHV